MRYTSEEVMDFEDVTPAEAQGWIADHGASWADFTAEVGDKPEYTGEEVLGWLGY